MKNRRTVAGAITVPCVTFRTKWGGDWIESKRHCTSAPRLTEASRPETTSGCRDRAAGAREAAAAGRLRERLLLRARRRLAGRETHDLLIGREVELQH